jgi:hypothetical protein
MMRMADINNCSLSSRAAYFDGDTAAENQYLQPVLPRKVFLLGIKDCNDE